MISRLALMRGSRCTVWCMHLLAGVLQIEWCEGEQLRTFGRCNYQLIRCRRAVALRKCTSMTCKTVWQPVCVRAELFPGSLGVEYQCFHPPFQTQMCQRLVTLATWQASKRASARLELSSNIDIATWVPAT